MTFWNSTLVKSGKRDHRCESCLRIVPAGQSSYSESGLCEGDFYSYRLCVPCRAFIGRQFETGNLERGESFELGWLPDIARDAGEPWPPTSADTRRNGEDAVKLAAEFTSGAVPEGQTLKVQRHD